MRSRPGNSLPNLTQCTMRVPGLTGSLGAGVGSQDSLAMQFSSKIFSPSPYCNSTQNPSRWCPSDFFAKPHIATLSILQEREFFETFNCLVNGEGNWRRINLPKITTLFWDIGGVILTNGWDRESRKAAAATFHLDWEEFEDRHDLSFPAFDSGLITLNEYLDRTLFYRALPFSREEFTAFMFAQSKEYPETRAILDKVTNAKKYFVGALNNEPLEQIGRAHV